MLFFGDDRSKFGEIFKRCRNYRFFDIFWDILDRRKGNFGQECRKRGPLSFQGKIEKIADSVTKVFGLLFHLSISKIWHFNPEEKLYFWNQQ